MPLPEHAAKRPAFRFQGQATRVSDDYLRLGEVPVGTFKLSGPAPKSDARCLPLRGDLAHIRLAGKFFVPHYVAPLSRAAGSAGATVREAAASDAGTIEALAPGARFDVLDMSGGWAWGAIGADGPVGYVVLTELAP